MNVGSRTTDCGEQPKSVINVNGESVRVVYKRCTIQYEGSSNNFS